VCFNPEQAQRDAVTRTAILDSLRMKLQRRGRGISTSASSENAFRLATYKRRAYAALQQRKEAPRMNIKANAQTKPVWTRRKRFIRSVVRLRRRVNRWRANRRQDSRRLP